MNTNADYKRVAVYLRVSTQDQSTDLQRREIEAYIASRHWPKPTFYEDKASGTHANRPMLKALLNDSRQRKVDVIVTWKLDRFFRSLKDLVVTLQELDELGIAYISLKDQIDMTTSSGRLMLHMVGAFAEFEASLIKERVRSGLQNAKARGKILGRPKKIAYDKIRCLRAQGLSIRAIAKELGISTGPVQSALVIKTPSFELK